MSNEKVKTFTTSNWDTDVLGSDKPVLVDFWAAWCSPCRMVAPIVDELAEEFAEKVTVGKLNVDEEGAVAGQYGVMSIPTLAVFKGGQVVEKVVGFRSKADLAKLLSNHA